MPRKKPSRRQLSWVALPLSIIVFVAVVFLIRNIGTTAGAETGELIGVDGKIVTITARVLLAIVAACMVIISFGELYKQTYRTLSGIMDPSDDADQGWFNDSLESRDKPKPTKTRYIAKGGDDLSSIASERYGSHEYARLLVHCNNVRFQERLRDGQVIRTPYLKTILAIGGLTKTHEAEVDLLLKAKTMYVDVEKDIVNLALAGKDEGLNIPTPLRKKLDHVANLIDRARIGFASAKGQVKTPAKVVEHLRRLADDLRKLPTVLDDASGYHLEAFHKRFVFVMLSAIEWAKNGYK